MANMNKAKNNHDLIVMATDEYRGWYTITESNHHRLIHQKSHCFVVKIIFLSDYS